MGQSQTGVEVKFDDCADLYRINRRNSIGAGNGEDIAIAA